MKLVMEIWRKKKALSGDLRNGEGWGGGAGGLPGDEKALRTPRERGKHVLKPVGHAILT